MDTKPSRIYLCEGVKNCGKTYLIEKSGLDCYKFPFASYFNRFLKDNTDNVGTGDKATYHFTTSFDVSLMSMAKHGLVKDGILIDRGFLSNIVLGVCQGRITDVQGYEYIDFLYKEGYIDSNVRIIYVQRGGTGGRDVPKDQWEYLDAEAVHNKYVDYIRYLQDEYNFSCDIFTNNFDEDSVHRFKLACVGSIILPKTADVY